MSAAALAAPPVRLPCPCGGRASITSVRGSGISAVRCDSCGKQAPSGLSDASAVRNWNAEVRQDR